MEEIEGGGYPEGDLDAIVTPAAKKKLEAEGLSPYRAEALLHRQKDQPPSKKFKPNERQTRRFLQSLRGQNANDIARADGVSNQAVQQDISIAVKKLGMFGRLTAWIRGNK